MCRCSNPDDVTLIKSHLDEKKFNKQSAAFIWTYPPSEQTKSLQDNLGAMIHTNRLLV